MVAVWPMAADGLSSEFPVQRANTLYGGCRQHSLIVVALINPQIVVYMLEGNVLILCTQKLNDMVIQWPLLRGTVRKAINRF